MNKELEEAWRQTCTIVLGGPLGPMGHYEGWLLSSTRAFVMQKSAISQRVFPLGAFKRFLLTREKVVDFDEAMKEGEKKLAPDEARALTLENAGKKLAALTHYSPEVMVGHNVELEQCTMVASSSHCYKTVYLAENKFCACSTWPRESEYAFGCDIAFSSQFCIKCYNSSCLKRCFEVSNGVNCSDCYFSHNIENCAECMFCFNTKAKRYAIGNVEYPKEEYLRVKKLLLAEISARLEKDKTLALSIYNLGRLSSAKAKETHEKL